MKSRLLFLSALFSAMAAGATDSTVTADTTTMLGEVSVTAFKSGGRLSAAPVALTTINGDEARRLNILSMKDVSALSPNFYIPQYGSRMTSSIYMRGIGARIDQPAVGLNVDNVPVLNKDAFDFDITDIERIEVIRGPQSTMYGRNTMAGLINITTTSPLRYQGVRVLLEAGSGTTLRGALSGYTKLNEKLGMSLSAQYNYTGGFVTNLHSGEKADRSRDAAARWKTEWRPSRRVRIENTASFSYGKQDGYPYAFAETDEVNYNDTCFYRRTTVTDGLTVTWNAPEFTMVSISSYQFIDDNMTLDQDFLPAKYFTLSQIRKEHAVTQEIVFRGDKGDYSWVSGAFGFYKHADMRAPVTFKETGIESLIVSHVNEYNPNYPIAWDEDSFILGSDFTNPVKGASVYHRSSLRLGNWNLSAGIRLDYEHTALDYYSHTSTSYTTYNNTNPARPTVYAHHPVDIDERGRLSHSFTNILPSLGVTFDAGPVKLYGSVAKGYKAGGFNTQMFSDVLQQRLMTFMGIAEKYDVDEIVSYKPEKSWNYEAGARLSLPDKGLEASAALFLIDCRDQQLTTFPDGTTTGRIMTNAGKTLSTGFELSARYTPAPRWTFYTAYGFTHATFKEFHNGRKDYSGNKVPYAPSNTLYLSGRYTHPVAKPWLESVSLDLNLRGIGEIWWDEDNSSRQPFYTQLGAILQLTNSHGNVEFSAENITSTKFDTFRYVSIGNNFFQRGRKATFRVTFRIFI